MGIEIKISSKGQVVIPKEMRDALGLKPGQSLSAIQTGGGILLRPAAAKSGRSFEEITAEIRKLYKHKGPPATIEQMNAAVDAMFAAKSRDEI